MIVADTSALITLATSETIETVLREFDVHTTETVIGELRETAKHQDVHGKAAEKVLGLSDSIVVHQIEQGVQSSRIDEGEGSCATLTREEDVDFLITDDLRALPELQNAADAKVAISPIVLKALVKRGVLENGEAEKRLNSIAEERDWLGAPIYRKARQLFEDE
jgi:predicted nucleic acid-binding protein